MALDPGLELDLEFSPEGGPGSFYVRPIGAGPKPLVKWGFE
jgi:hypothetical protein